MPVNMSKREPLTPTTRFEILKRDRFKCVACGRGPNEGVTLEVDHRVSVHKGGTNDMSNLQTLCFEHNRGKGIREMQEIDRPIPFDSHGYDYNLSRIKFRAFWGRPIVFYPEEVLFARGVLSYYGINITSWMYREDGGQYKDGTRNMVREIKRNISEGLAAANYDEDMFQMFCKGEYEKISDEFHRANPKEDIEPGYHVLSPGNVKYSEVE